MSIKFNMQMRCRDCSAGQVLHHPFSAAIRRRAQGGADPSRPTGAACRSSSSPAAKNILIYKIRIWRRVAAVPRRHKGRIAIVTDVVRNCGGRRPCRWTSGMDADGEIVWSRRPDAGVKSATMPKASR